MCHLAALSGIARRFSNFYLKFTAAGRFARAAVSFLTKRRKYQVSKIASFPHGGVIALAKTIAQVRFSTKKTDTRNRVLQSRRVFALVKARVCKYDLRKNKSATNRIDP